MRTAVSGRDNRGGLFVHFSEVFEGYLLARRVPGDYFELNMLGTALTGRRAVTRPATG